MLALGGCSGPKAYVRPGFLDHPPRRVAVLPFTISYAYDTDGQAAPESHAIGRDIFRKTFYYALTPLGYEDVKLAEVDEKLAAAWGPIEQGGWRQASVQALGQTLGVDALIDGDLSRVMHAATPLYTETSLDATLRMVDARSGEELWRKRVQASERGGVLFKKGQVVDLIEDQIRSANPSVKFLRVAEVAALRAMTDFPNPPAAGATGAPSSAGAALEPGRAARLAVLPLTIKKPQWRKAATALRADLVAGLQESPFEVLEIQQLDVALDGLGWKAGEPMPATLSPSGIAEALGADTLLQGEVTGWGRGYAVLASWVSAGLQAELIDGKSGEVLWSAKKRHTRHAGLLKGPTGLKSLAVAPITGIMGSRLDQVAMHLARDLAQDLSASPAVLAYLSEKQQR